MKLYIVNEADLQRLEDLAFDYGVSHDDINRIQLFQARKVVRSREVPKGATHFARIADMRDHDYPLPAGCKIAECVIEEIPK